MRELAALFDDPDEKVSASAIRAFDRAAVAPLGEERAAILRATASRRPKVRAAALDVLTDRAGVPPEEIVPRLAAVLREHEDDETLSAALVGVKRLGPKAAGAKAAVITLLEGAILAKGKWQSLDHVADALEGMKTKDRKAAGLLRRAGSYFEWQAYGEIARQHGLSSLEDIHFPEEDKKISRLRALSKALSE
jgi:hypothetical protein